MKILETERLILREFAETDDGFVLDILNQPSFIKYIGDRNVRNLEQARDFIETRYRKGYRENGFGLYAVELKPETAEFKTQNSKLKTPIIGMCGLVKRDGLPDADIGFAFLPQFEKKGYAFESASAVMDYGREVLKIEKVLAITTQDNESSIGLLKKLGFKFERLIVMPNDTEELNLFSSGQTSESGEAK